MKNIIKTTALLLCSIALFTACDDDRDNNPTIQTPTTFVLNEPSYAKANVDLATSEKLSFSWSQPDYGFPALASYQIQVSPTNQWTKDIQAGEKDAADQPVGDYKTFDAEYSLVKGDVEAKEVAKALQEICHYPEDGVPAKQNLYVRVRSAYAGDTIYSNAVQINVLPYYVELKDAAIDVWYLIGGCVGDGNWSNGPEDVGPSMLPLYTEAGQEYSKSTGVGTLTYTGYFPAGGDFKIVHYADNWQDTKDVICAGMAFRDGGDDPGNVVVSEAGYYKITLDPVKRTCTMEKVDDQTPNAFASMFISGDFNSWATDVAMKPVSTYEGAVNHDWYFDLDATSGATTAKFLADPDWKNNWGDTGFPYGYGTSNGANIPVKAGKYRVFFNDLTGQYHFIETAE